MPRRRTPKRPAKLAPRYSRFIGTAEDMVFVEVKSVVVEDSPGISATTDAPEADETPTSSSDAEPPNGKPLPKRSSS